MTMILYTHIDGDTITHILPDGLVNEIEVTDTRLSAKIIYPDDDDEPAKPAS